MTDRHFAYTVILKEPIREDDAEAIISAIRMIKGVVDVVPLVESPEIYFGYDKARRELGEKIWNVLYPNSVK